MDDVKFVQSLQKPSDLRTTQDIANLRTYIRLLDSNVFLLCDEALRNRGAAVRYESHPANKLLYRSGDIANCWYILLSGSVLIEGAMYVARQSFGMRHSGAIYRTSDCLVIDNSEVMVIDYSSAASADFILSMSGNANNVTYCRRTNSNPDSFVSYHRSAYSSESSNYSYADEDAFNALLQQQYHAHGSAAYGDHALYGSMASDTSSLYSGSDLMTSSLEDQGVDLRGLMESAVDSDDDEDDYPDQIPPLPLQDAVYDALVKKPVERTDADIDVLLEEIQCLLAFNNMTSATRRALCVVMEYVRIAAVDTTVMTDGEELDSWSVILNGQVQIDRPDGTVELLQTGDSFGIPPTSEKLYHRGMMRTKCDNCEFVCIPQDDYYRILHEGVENTRIVTEQGKTVLVTEERTLDGQKTKGRVIRGSANKLLSQLVEGERSAVDLTYVEDFLLTYRTFLNSPLDISDKLLVWYNELPYREKVVSIILQWVNDHYIDFEMEPKMSTFLEQFEQLLQQQGMKQHLRFLNKACAAKAKPRTVVLARASRDEVLSFSLLGGKERGCALFITKVEAGSKALDVGLKRGDQILDVNNQSFQHISHTRALEILRGSTHLSITVRSNLLGFKEMLQAAATNATSSSSLSSSGGGKRTGSKKNQTSRTHTGTRLSVASVPPVIITNDRGQSIPSHRGATMAGIGGVGEGKESKAFLSTGHGLKIRRALMKINLLPRSITSGSGWSPAHVGGSGSMSGNTSPVLRMKFSSSHPDLSTIHLYAGDELNGFSSEPDHVLKIYKADQAFRYLLIFKETTAHEVVMLALKEFGIIHPSSDYCLCEVTVQQEGFVKQRRLPDDLTNLADRCNHNSRYYLKANASTAALVPDELKDEITQECRLQFLLLNCAEVAAQLSLKDFQLFHDIEPVEYINDLFQLKSKYGAPNLTRFSQLSNIEMFWVVTEVCSEINLTRRAKIIKHFILIAKHCQECKNYNSMFAIISGLGQASVSRLRQTWEKLPAKYSKLFEDLQGMMDPSRNMSKYRNVIANAQPPLIPFFPLIKKDLTFIHLGNDSVIDDLINFEKLRMIAKEVRHVCSMAPAYSDMNSVNKFTSISASAVAVLRRRQRGGGGVGATMALPRKMFEEAQMVRRVRAYLTSFVPLDDETKLAEMSNQCEPPTGGGGPVMRRREEGSGPIPVAVRQSVSLGPKFGADSPDAVHKLLSLSDRVRVHDPHKSRVSPSICAGVVAAHSFRQSPSSSSSSSSLHGSYLTADSSSLVGGHVGNHSTTLSGADSSSSYNVPPSGHVTNRTNRITGSSLLGNESDSGHNSVTSTCDSNSISSVGSTGSPPFIAIGPASKTDSPQKQSRGGGEQRRIKAQSLTGATTSTSAGDLAPPGISSARSSSGGAGGGSRSGSSSSHTSTVSLTGLLNVPKPSADLKADGGVLGDIKGGGGGSAGEDEQSNFVRKQHNSIHRRTNPIAAAAAAAATAGGLKTQETAATDPKSARTTPTSTTAARTKVAITDDDGPISAV